MLIIGGTGDTGSWFARYFKDHGLDVSIWGPSGRVEVAKRLGVTYEYDPLSAASNSDIVMISVPIARTKEVIRDFAPRLKPGSLLMDVTSLKLDPVRVMAQAAPDGVEIIGTHPMFGPTMPAIKGQTVILTPVEGRCDRWLPFIKKILEDSGARVEVLSPEEHDSIMAVVQALTHFAYIGIGATLHALNFDVQRSRRFMSPVYEIMLDFVGRILEQSPELYASIQSNPQAEHVRRTFINQCVRMAEMVDSGDLESFREVMQEAAQHYGSTKDALRRSDRIINQRSQQPPE